MAAATSQLVSAPLPPSSRYDDREIAVKANCDPRTVYAAYRGKVSPLARAAIAKAACELGFAPPPAPEPTRAV